MQSVLDTVPGYHADHEVLTVVQHEMSGSQRQEVLAASATSKTPISDQELRSVIDKLHRNLGYSSVRDLVRILKHGHASDRAIQLAREYTCEFCKSCSRPKTPLLAQTHRSSEFNAQLGLDVKFLPGWKANQKVTALNFVDQASCYQKMIPFFTTEMSQVLRDLYHEHWVSWAGPPTQLVLDPKRTHLGDPMTLPTEREGAFIRQIAAEAHWNHGGWFERVL